MKSHMLALPAPLNSVETLCGDPLSSFKDSNEHSIVTDKSLVTCDACALALGIKRVEDFYAPGQPMLRDVEIDGNTISMHVGSLLTQNIVAIYKNQMEHVGATNYMEFTVDDSATGDSYVVLVQKKSGKTPNQLKVEAEDKIQELAVNLGMDSHCTHSIEDIQKWVGELGSSNA